MHNQAQQKHSKTVDHFVAPNRLPRASHKQRLTVAYTRGFADLLIHRNKYKKANKIGRKRNRPQMKKQGNSPEEKLEIRTSNLSDREFKVMIMRILSSIKKKDIETIKKDQSEIKNAISEINYTLEGINSRLDEPEN